MTTADRPRKELLAEIENLRIRLEDAEETLRAIGSGEVDAFVVSGPEGEQVFTLKGAEQPYRVLVETMSEGAATLAPDGTILYCNNRLAAMLQIPLERLIGTQLGSYVASVGNTLFTARLKMDASECASDEVTLITGQGSSLPALVSCCRLELSGSPGLSVVITDLTQQKHNEEIMASERLARSIIEQAGEAIVVCDAWGRIIRASLLAHQLCGENPLLKLFDASLRLVAAESGEQVSISQVLAGVTFRNMEVVLKQGADLETHLILNAATIKDNEAKTYGCVVTLTDITARKQMEQALRESEQQLRLLVDGVQDFAIFMLDAKGRVISWNEGAKRLKGWDKEEILGRHFSVFYPEELVAAGHPEEVLGTAADSGLYEEEGWRVRKDGSKFLADVNITAIRDESSKLLGFSKVTRDVTVRSRAEEALKNAYVILEKRVKAGTEELREKDRMLLFQSRQAAMGEMIGNIAHQWRQPLNTLGLTIQQMMLYYELGEFTQEFLEQSVRSSMELIEHMSKTIDDFRNYFRPDKEKVEFKVSEAIASTLSLIEDSFKSKNITVEVIAKNDPTVFGYRNEFAQVLLNILNNAGDVLAERGSVDPKVTITFGSEVERSVITIADNGGGIPEEIINKVFDPYFTTKGPQHGTGVGLYMSKTIIEKNMEGRLSVRNTAEGAEFRIEV